VAFGEHRHRHLKSGVIVIDVDKKEGKDGQATLDALTKKGRTLPSSPIVLTPTGGRHHFYRAVPGIKNVVEMQGSRGIGSGIDVRADGGFAVAPPSALVEWRSADGTLIHGAGQYRWLVTANDGGLSTPAGLGGADAVAQANAGAQAHHSAVPARRRGLSTPSARRFA
jgi:hypothetical protein